MGEDIPFDWQNVFGTVDHQIGLGLSCRGIDVSGAWTETSRDLSLLEVWRWQSLAGLVLGHMHNRFQGLWASGEVSAGVCHDLPCGKGRHEGLSESRWGREHTF